MDVFGRFRTPTPGLTHLAGADPSQPVGLPQRRGSHGWGFTCHTYSHVKHMHMARAHMAGAHIARASHVTHILRSQIKFILLLFHFKLLKCVVKTQVLVNCDKNTSSEWISTYSALVGKPSLQILSMKPFLCT